MGKRHGLTNKNTEQAKRQGFTETTKMVSHTNFFRVRKSHCRYITA